MRRASSLAHSNISAAVTTSFWASPYGLPSSRAICSAMVLPRSRISVAARRNNAERSMAEVLRHVRNASVAAATASSTSALEAYA